MRSDHGNLGIQTALEGPRRPVVPQGPNAKVVPWKLGTRLALKEWEAQGSFQRHYLGQGKR